MTQVQSSFRWSGLTEVGVGKPTTFFNCEMWKIKWSLEEKKISTLNEANLIHSKILEGLKKWETNFSLGHHVMDYC